MSRVGKRLLVLLALGVGACAALGPNAKPCFSSKDCPGAAQCILGECTTNLPAFPIDLELTPAPASDYLSQPVRQLALSPSGSLEVVVPQPVKIDVQSDIPLKVTFDAVGELRHPLSFTADVVQSASGGKATGTANVVAGIVDGSTGALDPLPYDAVVVPTASGCCDGTTPCTAPVTVHGLVPSADTVWVPPYPTSAVTITGRVEVSVDQWTPIEALQVQAFDPDTGVFTLPTQTASDGSFCLAVAPPPKNGAHHLTLRLGPSDTRPTVEVPNIVVPDGVPTVDLGVVAMGDHGAPLPPLRVEVDDPTGAPIGATKVSFEGLVDPKGTFSASATTDVQGVATVTLLRGVYTVTAEPPATSAFGPVVQDGFDPTTLAATAPLTLEALPRPRVTGVVDAPATGTDGPAPLAGVTVIADPDPNPPNGSAPPAQGFSTTTDKNGSYTLALDPGTYRVRFEPPPGSGLPWTVGRSLTATDDRTLDTVVLEDPVVVPGKVLGRKTDGTTTPLAGAKVEIYGRTQSGRSVLVWQVRTGDDGSFEVRLPRSLAGTLRGH